jgi:molybdopterin molybdotransferase
MSSVKEAQKLIIDAVEQLPGEQATLLASAGRVAAATVMARWDLPQYDNSAMDGYAVRSVECVDKCLLSVAGTVMAGGRRDEPAPFQSAVKIMTGAPLPADCDAVIPFEEILEEKPNAVVVPGGVKSGAHVRFRGEDIHAGEPVVTAGYVIRPAEINMLAAAGIVHVPVYRRVKVAILSTGDELVESGEIPTYGKIINSNAPALAAAVIEAGGEPVLLGIARDTRDSLREKITAGLEADVLITSAGVSAGEGDLVREVLTEAGVVPVFWKIDIKPGGPTAFGIKGSKPVFSLPGNPVSSMLTFETFVRPALLKMMGHSGIFRPLFRGELQDGVEKKAGKATLLRVMVSRVGETYKLKSAGKQQTGLQRTLVMADAIALLPAERTVFHEGELVDFHFMHDSALMLPCYYEDDSALR